ncbi:olefin beta-lactone synthetase [Shewanella youngdeokensis]|uniref:Fatty acid CoA ligase family protein n=1 Tax=Shewanella youngdeokensis TaxID=2999068 RepID=A0ABZ0JUZ1_9GAMM|nr:fatty acid CoA ligase family protein [Shewanella sp. DAU334]
MSNPVEAQQGNANLCRHLVEAANTIPDHLAAAVQHSAGRSIDGLSYEEMDFQTLNRKSDHIAAALIHFGLTPGMKAVLMVTPSIDFFCLTFGLFKAGIVPILVDPGMGVKNLKQCFIEAKPDVFIGIPKAHIARRLFGWGKRSVKHLITVGGGRLINTVTGAYSLDDIVNNSRVDPQPFAMQLLNEDAMAAILFTSGSTGTPKGVVYSHKMFEAQISALKLDYGIKPGERDLATFPLFSLFGPALGMASIVPDMDASKPITANPDFIFAAIEKYQCSNMFINPALIERLGDAGSPVNHKIPSIKRVISAGAPATIGSIKRFSTMLNSDVEVLNSYGATEALPLSKIGSQSLFNTTDVTDHGGGICVGDAIEGVVIAIIDIDENPISQWHEALKLPANQIGEIVVKGSMVSRSYYQRDTATRAAKMTDGVATRHRMGDLGYLDDAGLLWMCGRKAHRVDAITAAGSMQRYYSIPTERIFNTHPEVKRSALVGVVVAGRLTPLVCIELDTTIACSKTNVLYQQLCTLAEQHSQTQGIIRFLIHPNFPVDIRHNAKIFREKLAIWAQKQIKE